MTKFKVGDRVRVVKTPRGASEYRVCPGDLGEVSGESPYDFDVRVTLDKDGQRWAFDDGDLELIEPEAQNFLKTTKRSDGKVEFEIHLVGKGVTSLPLGLKFWAIAISNMLKPESELERSETETIIL